MLLTICMRLIRIVASLAARWCCSGWPTAAIRTVLAGDAAEAGLDLTPGGGIKLSATAFDNRVRHAIANVTILDTKAGAVIVDSGPSKRYGEALAKLAGELTGKPVVRVYLTHFHPDHVFGNQAFAPQALATTQKVADGLKRMGDDFAAAMYRTAGDWMRGTEVVLPETIVTAGVEDFGDRKLRLVPLSGHTDSDLAILDERSGLLFAGDLVFLDRAATTPNAELESWRASLAALGALGHTRLVPGHGPAEAGTRGITQTGDWLALVEGTISDAFGRGLDVLEARDLPLPPWAEKIALARYEFERSVMHLYPKLEAKGLPRVDRKA